MKSFNDLVAKVTGLGGDVAKADAGNKTAGVRLRAGMQDVKALADQVRKDVLAVRDGDSPDIATTPKTFGSKL